MKRILCAVALMGVSLVSMAQVNYRITYKGLENGKKLFLNNAETREALDSAVVEAGVAKFSGQLSESVVAVVNERAGQVRGALYEMVLDEFPVIEDDTMVEGSVQNLRYAQYQEEERKHNTKADDIIHDYQQLQQEYGQDIPEDKMMALRQRMEVFSEESHLLTLKRMEDNRDNLIPLLLLMYDADNLGYPYVGEYLKTYELADRPSLQQVKDMLKREEVKQPGAKVVDFTMKNLQGEPVSLTDWVGKGNYVLVDFWASWCGPCRQDMPHVKSLYEKYHPQGFEIVGVSLDSKQEAWAKGVQDLDITWPQMSDLKYWQSEGAALYNIRAIPATILFAPDGTVVEAGLRGESLTKKLEEIYEQK